MFNLDDEKEVNDFIAKYGTTKGRRLANMLGIKGRGAVENADNYSNYAWNKYTAINLRREGSISRAMYYETICENIYFSMTPEYKW